MAKQNYSGGKVKLKYDTYGRPLQNRGSSSISNTFLRFFFGFLIPYVLINGIIFFLAVARPSITAEEPDTQDFKSASVRVSVSSLLPVKEFTASLEGDKVDLERDGSSYIANVHSNGTLSFLVTSINGMSANSHVQVNLLDDNAPEIDENSIILEQGFLEISIRDEQSGVNFDSVYGIDGDGDKIMPSDLDTANGIVRFSLKSDNIQVFFSDNAGNEGNASFSLR